MIKAFMDSNDCPAVGASIVECAALKRLVKTLLNSAFEVLLVELDVDRNSGFLCHSSHHPSSELYRVLPGAAGVYPPLSCAATLSRAARRPGEGSGSIEPNYKQTINANTKYTRSVIPKRAAALYSMILTGG